MFAIRRTTFFCKNIILFTLRWFKLSDPNCYGLCVIEIAPNIFRIPVWGISWQLDKAPVVHESFRHKWFIRNSHFRLHGSVTLRFSCWSTISKWCSWRTFFNSGALYAGRNLSGLDKNYHRHELCARALLWNAQRLRILLSSLSLMPSANYYTKADAFHSMA